MKFKIGIMNSAGPAPEGKNPVDHNVEFILKGYENKLTAFNFPFGLAMKYDQGVVDTFAALRKEKDLGFVVYTMGTGVFQFPSPRKGPFALDEAASLALIETNMKVAKGIGEKFVRISYGTVDFETTRYNQNVPLDEHVDRVTRGLKKIIPLCEEYDCDVVIENHCDFSGIEIARAVENVGSDRFGIFIDTGNDATTWTDFHSGNNAMLPFVRHAGHLKDVKGRLDPDYESGNDVNGRFPVQLTACYLGEGLVDIKGIVEYIKNNAKCDEFYMLSEILWTPEGYDTADCHQKAVEYMYEITKE